MVLCPVMDIGTKAACRWRRPGVERMNGPREALARFQRREQGWVAVAVSAQATLKVSGCRLCGNSWQPFIGQNAPAASGLLLATARCREPGVLMTLTVMRMSLKDLSVVPCVSEGSAKGIVDYWRVHGKKVCPQAWKSTNASESFRTIWNTIHGAACIIWQFLTSCSLLRTYMLWRGWEEMHFESWVCILYQFRLTWVFWILLPESLILQKRKGGCLMPRAGLFPLLLCSLEPCWFPPCTTYSERLAVAGHTSHLESYPVFSLETASVNIQMEAALN